MNPKSSNEDTELKTEERLLLVDDNPANLQVLMETLQGQNYKLLAAKNGEMALAIARKAQPELILLDIMMPGIDGYEVCRRLKSDPHTSEIAIIFLSAMDATQDKVKGFKLGAVDYITKPFQPEEVIARVETHLTIHRLQQSLELRNQELQELNANLERKVEEKSKELLNTRDAVIFGLAKLTETRDDDTGLHLERICKFVEILARKIAKNHPEIDDRWIRTVTSTAALHDIGKVGIPDAVLNKPGPLTSEEREIIQMHPTIGGDTLLEIRDQWGNSPFLARAIEISMAHHEKWDGNGYPFGIKGDAIALSARILAVADVYDALTCKRIYKDGMPHAKVKKIIAEGSGKDFDPEIVEAFMATEKEIEKVAQELRTLDENKTVGIATINRQKAMAAWRQQICEFVELTDQKQPKK